MEKTVQKCEIIMSKINEIKYQECITSAPSSTANLGPGYDIFGLGLDALEDIVCLKVIEKSKSNLNNRLK